MLGNEDGVDPGGVETVVGDLGNVVTSGFREDFEGIKTVNVDIARGATSPENSVFSAETAEDFINKSSFEESFKFLE